MASITLYTRNILETGTVTVTGTADIGKPETRLYDRGISLYWVDTATEAKIFLVDQGASNILAVDTLIIDKHNFDGEDMEFNYSTDNFSADTNDAVTDWTQSGNTQILKEMSASQTKRYWRVQVTSMTNPKCSEIFMSYGYEFNVTGLPIRQPIDAVQWNKTVGGNERSTQFGEEKRQRSYITKFQDSTGLTNFRAAMDALGGYSKPFYLKDDEGNVFLVRLTDIPAESPITKNNKYSQFALNMIEVL